MQLAEQIRAARQHMGWTQAELATRLRVARNYVSMLELGTRNPSPQMLASIARLTGRRFRDERLQHVAECLDIALEDEETA